MGSVKTSSIFYYRGVPKTFTDFRQVASGNYAIFQPARPTFNSPFFSKSISNFISVYR
jgi:hypothetical protein